MDKSTSREELARRWISEHLFEIHPIKDFDDNGNLIAPDFLNLLSEQLKKDNMGIKVNGPDPMPGLMTAGPNPPIDGTLPFPEAVDGSALSKFNTPQDGAVKLPDNQAIPAFAPSPNAPIPDTSTVAPARLMTAGLPTILNLPNSIVDVTGTLGS